METKFKIKRFDPTEQKSYYQTFNVTTEPGDTILEALLTIQGKQDQTFAMRCSCKSAICGSCAMKVNKRTRLACNTQIRDLELINGEILVEPMGNMPVIRDLIVELEMHWEKLRGIDPFLKVNKPPDEREYLCSNESMVHVSHVTECIQCASCVSDCTVLEVDKSFRGPAALAKVYRFVSDPRDTNDKHRLTQASKSSEMWDCTHCFKCVEACPKLTRPMERILALRKTAMKKGYRNNCGSRHSYAILDSIKHSGTLNENTVMPKSFGYLNIPKLLSIVPVGLRMASAGKLPPLIHKKIGSIKKVQKIFDKLEREN